MFAQSCLTLYDLMYSSTPGLSVPHHIPKFAQVHVHHIGDAIQSSHPPMPSSPSALNIFQNQGLFQWVSCSHQMTKILEFQLQHLSFQQVFRVDFPLDWLVWFLCCQRDIYCLYIVDHGGCNLVTKPCPILVTPRTVACQAPLY